LRDAGIIATGYRALTIESFARLNAVAGPLAVRPDRRARQRSLDQAAITRKARSRLTANSPLRGYARFLTAMGGPRVRRLSRLLVLEGKASIAGWILSCGDEEMPSSDQIPAPK